MLTIGDEVRTPSRYGGYVGGAIFALIGLTGLSVGGPAYGTVFYVVVLLYAIWLIINLVGVRLTVASEGVVYHRGSRPHAVTVAWRDVRSFGSRRRLVGMYPVANLRTARS